MALSKVFLHFIQHKQFTFILRMYKNGVSWTPVRKMATPSNSRSVATHEIRHYPLPNSYNVLVIKILSLKQYKQAFSTKVLKPTSDRLVDNYVTD